MKLLKFAIGGIAGAAVGFVAGVMLAPRSGAESRAMASDAVNDAWDSAVDTYERGQQAVNEKIGSMRPNVDATTDELRAKVDLARERMDQLRDSLSAAAEQAEVDSVVEVVEEPAAEEAAGEPAAAEEPEAAEAAEEAEAEETTEGAEEPEAEEAE